MDHQADTARGARDFTGSVFRSLRSVGYHVSLGATDVFLLDTPNVMKLLHNKLQGVYDFDLYSPKHAPFAGVLCCPFHWFRLYIKRRRYCQLPFSGRRMQRFLQFRLASDRLPVATHRLASDRLPDATHRLAGG